VARFESIQPFERFLLTCQEILTDELVAYDYDTFTSLIQFHSDFRKTDLSLVNFVSSYKRDLSNYGLSCVGLSLSLIKRLRQALPAFARCISLVSCEEVVKDYGTYCIESPNTLKEHVLVAIRINVDFRHGYVILDPGYHVARPVVVMKDEQCPHTSWFVQSATGTVTKEYCYELFDDRFVAWNVKETRRDGVNQWSNLIFVEKAFAKCFTITQKRALFYAFKSLVVRDRKGPIAGLYCHMKNNGLTIFYPEKGQRKQVKLSIDKINSEEMTYHLEVLAKHFNGMTYGRALSFLSTTVYALKSVLDDKEFVEELLELDDWIEEEA